MNGLVLSLFPGIGLLDMAFEEEGFCVVRGPDLLWGGDVQRFHPPTGRFDGVIGGPPCQHFSPLVKINDARGAERKLNLIPEFERVVEEAGPVWFVMEQVPEAPKPVIPGWHIYSALLRDSWVGGETRRLRRFSFGSGLGIVSALAARALQGEQQALHNPEPEPTVLASEMSKGRIGKPGGGTRPPTRTLEHQLRLQGLPADFYGPDSPFTLAAKGRMIGNGVPLPMGRAVARAVKAALQVPEVTA